MRRVVFMHIHKTGGQTVIRHLEEMLPHYKSALRDERGRIDMEAVADANLIAGHFSQSDWGAIAATDDYECTVVRDPLDRLISHLKFLKQHNEDDLARYDVSVQMLVNRLPWEELVQNNIVRSAYSNWISKQCAPLKLDDFDLVGRTDKMSDFIQKLSADLGCPAPNVVHSENRSRLRLTINPDVIEALRDWVVEDYAFLGEYVGG